MKTLNDFPRVMQAFIAIDQDNRGVHAPHLDQSTEIDEYLSIAFGVAESVLEVMQGKTADYVPALRQLEEYSDGFGEVELWRALVLPVNDTFWDICKHMVISPGDAFTTHWVMDEYFDGELSRKYDLEFPSWYDKRDQT